jgi:hypothetical protein
MQVRKVVISTAVGVGMGAAMFAGAGAASADNSNWHPGDGKWQPGAGLATLSSNLKVSSNNLNGAFSPKVGDIKVLSGNSLSVLNGSRILSGNSILNGSFSGNVFNSGADSFNTTVKDSYNKYVTVTTGSSHKPKSTFGNGR